jgi:hypothetical protein
MKNYFNQLMQDGYHLLIQDKINWPYELETDQKVQLLNLAIEYFQELEEYEKCTLLQKKIEVLNTPKKKKGRPKKISYVKKENSTRN